MAEEKTEAPTPKRKKEARKEGQVPRTQELGSWLVLFAFAGASQTIFTKVRDHFVVTMKTAFKTIENPEQADAVAVMDEALRFAAIAIVAIGLGVLFISLIASVAQGGFYLATKAAKPKFSKVNPASGAKRLFSSQTLWEGAKTLIKTFVLGVIIFAAGKGMAPIVTAPTEPSAVLGQLASTLRNILLAVSGAGLVMAAADYAFQRRRVGKQIRMSKQEIKQENKNTEGDPLIKSAIRSRALANARNRMMAAIPEADAVLVNPTHVAVALKYDAEKGAPRVVARGAGNIAAKIREKAAESQVPIIEDVPLARALYASCQVGQDIPAELFAAVAQILAFVYSRKPTSSADQPARSPRDSLEVPVVTSRRMRRIGPGDEDELDGEPEVEPGDRPSDSASEGGSISPGAGRNLGTA